MDINIKDFMNEDIFATLNSFVSKMENRLTRNMYVGTIVEHDSFANGDDGTPSALSGKCRILVYGVYDGIPFDKLPYAVPDEHWVGSTVGSFVVPPIGTLVRVTFDGDNIYRPVYSSKILQAGKVDPNIAKNYPHNMVTMTTDAGSSIQHDRSTGEEIKTNIVGDFTPETVKLSSPSQGASVVVTDEAASQVDDGKIVETINGAADSIEDSFYNKDITINNDGTAVATNKYNITKSDGSVEYDHTLSADGHNVNVSISDAGELTISHTDGANGTDTIVFGADNYTVTDKYGNTVAMTQQGLKILALQGQGVGAGHNYTAAQSNCNPGLATPDPALLGGWCAIPICPVTGMPHVGNMMSVIQPPT